MIDIKNLDYLLYSSHKTGTQSIKNTLIQNGYKSKHIHTLKHLISENLSCVDMSHEKVKEIFLNKIKDLNKSGKKLKIITCIRDPMDRLLSSFFQSYHSDKVMFNNYLPHETPVMTLNKGNLINMYRSLIINNKLPGGYESLEELFDIFNFNELELIEKDNYYCYENEYVEIIVIKFIYFKELTTDYLSKCLNITLRKSKSSNLSSDKIYYDKYLSLKTFFQRNIGLRVIIEKRYNNLYNLL